MRTLTIAAILPHLEVFGGIRRYLSLGNAWVALGHRVVLFTPTGEAPVWMRFAGEVRSWEGAPRRDGAGPGAPPFDVAFTPQAALLPQLRSLPAARRVYYCVIEKEPGEADALRDPAITLMANSSALRASLARRARRPVLDGIGGIDPTLFHPDPAVVRTGRHVLAYGRRSRARKGTDLIVDAVRQARHHVPDLELTLFDHVGPGNEADPRQGFDPGFAVRWVLNPTAVQLAALYAASDVFVAAERRAGWCNTAIEALASGCALVCTPSGTGDFARNGETALVVRWRHPWFVGRAVARALADDALRARLGAAGPGAVAPFAWPVLAEKMLAQLAPGRV
jgi:glycosyltransferase involved in cell wall biosynthesis